MPRIALSPDGSSLAYADYGDPRGYPILIQHGMVASIRDAGLFRRLIDRGARVICLARPGYGDSAPVVLQNIGEWANLAAAIVHELKLSQFDVLGLSSGAPYSYALGHRFPHQVRHVYILSGTPALYDDAIRAHWPYPVDQTATLAELQPLARELFFTGLSPADLAQNDVRDSMANDCFGIAQDLQLRCRDWGFRLAEVTSLVYMRHSRADKSVPFVTAEMTARQLPHCQFEARENDAHFSPAVLDDFIRTVIAPRLL